MEKWIQLVVKFLDIKASISSIHDHLINNACSEEDTFLIIKAAQVLYAAQVAQEAVHAKRVLPFRRVK